MRRFLFFCCVNHIFFIKITGMRKVSVFLYILLITTCNTMAANTRPNTRASAYVDSESYSYMYPYLSNKMRTELNPGVTVSQTNNPIDVLVRTKKMSEPRRVVPRKVTTTSARSATTTNVVARAATASPTTQPRRVVPRTSAIQTSVRGTNATQRVRAAAIKNDTDTEYVSTARCLADYTECMNDYCERKDTAYNRCYCSSKLAQIDSTYQPQITNLVNQIIALQNGGGTWTWDEMNQYWMDNIGQYVGENSFENLENALNIDWSTTENRMRGQQAFVTGHTYCSQHLRACAPVASNLRDAYRSQISRDCQSYENGLIRIKNAAESLVQHYSE